MCCCHHITIQLYWLVELLVQLHISLLSLCSTSGFIGKTKHTAVTEMGQRRGIATSCQGIAKYPISFFSHKRPDYLPVNTLILSVLLKVRGLSIVRPSQTHSLRCSLSYGRDDPAGYGAVSTWMFRTWSGPQVTVVSTEQCPARG